VLRRVSAPTAALDHAPHRADDEPAATRRPTARGNVDADPTSSSVAPAADEPAARPGRRGSAVAGVIEALKTLVLAVVLFFIVQVFVAQPFQVEQFSMQHTFEPGDYVLVDKLTPHWDAYSRGDVIVFNPPVGWETERKAPFIKRVIGTAGDSVEVRDGIVHVNGVALDEPYLYADAAGVRQPTEADQPAWVVAPGELFVMGDHRQMSEDSRVFGPIPLSSVIGRAFVRYWPLGSLGIVQTPGYPGVPAP
jgi:signal peptidase I